MSDDTTPDQTPAPAPKVVQLRPGGLPPIPTASLETRHVVVITGRGQAAGRASTLVRLRPDVVAEIKSLVDGPLYLTIELALRHFAQDLRKRSAGSVELIRAEDLG